MSPTTVRAFVLGIRDAWEMIRFNPRPPLPPSVNDLIKDPSSVSRRHPRYNKRSSHRRHFKNRSLASLYRLYEFYIIDDTIKFRNEIEWFWHSHQWPVHEIPDPKDDDPLRYAILAGLTEILCLAFNRLINEGLPRGSPPIIGDIEALLARPKVIETQPDWALKVAPLPEKAFVPNNEGQIVTGENSSNIFRKFNVYIEQPHFYFV